MYGERQLLIKILSRMEEGQIIALQNELGADTPEGRALTDILKVISDTDGAEEENISADTAKETAVSKEAVTFYKVVTGFIDRAGKTESYVYNQNHMDRKLWYRLRDKPGAKTSKRNLLKMAIVLELNYWEMHYLVNLGGYPIMPALDPTDKVIAKHVRQRKYDKEAINKDLKEAGEEPLFVDWEE